MTKLIEIKRWDNQELIHSGQFESVKECLEDGVKKGIVFNFASLDGASLDYASLDYAILNGASLDDASLNRASLNRASLNRASLDGASLDNVSLWSCRGNNKQIKSLHISSDYDITYTKDVLQIGCEQHPIQAWWDFDDRTILAMDGKTALSFWKEYKDLIKTLIEHSPAT